MSPASNLGRVGLSAESLLDGCVGAFEEALNRGDADLAPFLPSPDHPAYLEILVELIRVDLDRRWQGGQQRLLESYRERFPEAFRSEETRGLLAFEEFRVRRRAGQAPLAREYHDRFGVDISDKNGKPIEGDATARRPAQGPVEASLLDATVRKPVDNLVDAFRAAPEVADLVQSMRQSNPDAARRWSQALGQMPEAGAAFLEFHLIAELGRGAFGKVFLARQEGLARRFVALKIAADLDHESQTLAQLQHTNIVPIYSVHRSGSLQAVCMPYFGATTLAHVYREVTRDPHLPQSGKVLVSTVRGSRKWVDGAEAAFPPNKERPVEPSGLAEDVGAALSQYAPFRVLGNLSYVESVLWLGARIAEGLSHAHDRGILHRDLKPANILLTDEGQPMLLDFNLAEDRKETDALTASVGGTLPYMSPEQLEGFTTGKGKLGTASDVYSLGVILFELLTGKSPFPTYRLMPVHESLPRMLADRRNPAPGLRRLNPHVSFGIEAIVRHCLDPDPDKRYASAQDLREDLERQLHNQPLKHVAEPSLRERLGKFRRRHPRLISIGSVALVAACLVAVLTVGLLLRGESLARRDAQETARGLHREKGEVEFLLAPRTAADQAERGIATARECLGRFGVLEDADWAEGPLMKRLSAGQQEAVRKDVEEVLWLCLRVSLMRAEARPGLPGDDLDLAEAFLERALPLHDTVPRWLAFARARVARLRGENARAKELEQRAEQMTLQSARDYYDLAFEEAERGLYREAIAHLDEAVRIAPGDYNTWFLRGYCYDGLGRHKDAVDAYSPCIALRPRFFRAYFNRGLARLREKRFAPALQDLDRVVELRPDHADAYFNRALIFNEAKEWKKAEADLTRALELGSEHTPIYFLRARVRDQLNDPGGAKRDRERGWKGKPRDAQGWVARGVARLPKDPDGAVADFDQALRVDKRSLPALQNKAFVLMEYQKDLPAAVRVLDRAVTAYPDDPRPRAGRGVLLARLGQTQAAVNDAEVALAIDNSAANQYQVAGIYALASRKNPRLRDDAFRWLLAALKNGFGHDYLATDGDLDPLRADPRFARLTAWTRGP